MTKTSWVFSLIVLALLSAALALVTRLPAEYLLSFTPFFHGF